MSPKVRSISSAPCTPHFWNYHSLDWLDTVPVINKVDGEMRNFQIGSTSFTMENQFQIGRSFSEYLLPSVDCFPKTIQIIWLEKNHLVVRNIYKMIRIGEINCLVTCMPHLWTNHVIDWMCAVPVTKYYLWENYKLSKRFDLLHYCKPIASRLVFWCLPLTFAYIFYRT